MAVLLRSKFVSASCCGHVVLPRCSMYKRICTNYELLCSSMGKDWSSILSMIVKLWLLASPDTQKVFQYALFMCARKFHHEKYLVWGAWWYGWIFKGDSSPLSLYLYYIHYTSSPYKYRILCWYWNTKLKQYLTLDIASCLHTNIGHFIFMVTVALMFLQYFMTFEK